jgi:hypothetical protein
VLHVWYGPQGGHHRWAGSPNAAINNSSTEHMSNERQETLLGGGSICREAPATAPEHIGRADHHHHHPPPLTPGPTHHTMTTSAVARKHTNTQTTRREGTPVGGACRPRGVPHMHTGWSKHGYDFRVKQGQNNMHAPPRSVPLPAPSLAHWYCGCAPRVMHPSRRTVRRPQQAEHPGGMPQLACNCRFMVLVAHL